MDSHDGGVGWGGKGSVWGRGSSTKMYGANVPTQQAVKVGGRVTGGSDIASSPSAFSGSSPPRPPLIHGATSPTCRREASNAHGHVRGILRRHGEAGEPSERSRFRRGAIEI